jgi:hypothetical protein
MIDTAWVIVGGGAPSPVITVASVGVFESAVAPPGCPHAAIARKATYRTGGPYIPRSDVRNGNRRDDAHDPFTIPSGFVAADPAKYGDTLESEI